MNEKICVFCEYFDLRMDEPDWSEVTLGTPQVFRCSMNHWEMVSGEDEIAFRAKIAKASTCRDYQLAVHDPKP